MTGRALSPRTGRPLVLQMDRVVPGPPEVVWELVTDWEHQGDWMLEASEFRVISAHRRGEGVEVEATIKIGGIRTRDRVRVVGWEPPQRLRIAHHGWVTGYGTIRLARLEDGATLVRWTEELHPPLGPVGWLGIRIFAPLMARVFRRDIRILEGLVRARVRRDTTAS